MTLSAFSHAFISPGISATRAVGPVAGNAMASGGQVMAIVVKLLDDAESALVTDRATAKACITRASALLQAEGGRQKQNSDGPSGTVTRGGLASWQIRRVTAYIEANLMAAIRLKDFTEITRLSTSHFARAFKASLGESVHGYIIRRRMERAQELMLTTNESLCQIALTCGLSDQAHFSRVFRRVVGVSPNVWRRQWLGHGSAGPAHAARALNG